jgi:putative flippase GtrA
MRGDWTEIFSLLKAWRWRELLYKPTDNATLQFLRYLIVGGCAFVADFCTVWLLKELGLHYLVAGVFGFILGVVVNYILSKTLAFSGKKANMSKEAEFALFIVISLIGLGLNSLIVFLLKDISLVPRFVDTTLDWDFWVAKVIATAIVTVWNFVANNFFTFRKRDEKIRR